MGVLATVGVGFSPAQQQRWEHKMYKKQRGEDMLVVIALRQEARVRRHVNAKTM